MISDVMIADFLCLNNIVMSKPCHVEKNIQLVKMSNPSLFTIDYLLFPLIKIFQQFRIVWFNLAVKMSQKFAIFINDELVEVPTDSCIQNAIFAFIA